MTKVIHEACEHVAYESACACCNGECNDCYIECSRCGEVTPKWDTVGAQYGIRQCVYVPTRCEECCDCRGHN